MSELFEAMWRDGSDHVERVFSTELNKSITRIIKKDSEYFVPSQIGNYAYVLDKEIKLDKRYGSFKHGQDEFGFQNVIGHHIRDSYWSEDAGESKYNRNPGIFFIDIETRVGVSYKHEVDESRKIKVRKKE